MSNDEITKLNERLNALQSFKGEMINLIEKKKALEESSEVREYLEVLEGIKNCSSYSFEDIDKMTDAQLIEKAIKDFCPKESKKIYVVKAEASDFISDIVVLVDLESGSPRFVEKEEFEEFKKENNVIYPMFDSFDNYYRKLRAGYFGMVLRDGNDEDAYERVLGISHFTIDNHNNNSQAK